MRSTDVRAVTLDFWDTLYHGASSPARVALRKAALTAMLERIGHRVAAEEFDHLYRAAAQEADRWWRDEHRGYTTEERVRWILGRLAVERPDGCEHVADAVRAVDESLLSHPPPLLDGTADALRRLASRYRLAIISDTGFASGEAQNRLLERDGVRHFFEATIYSMDVGHAKPRPEPFAAAVAALQVAPSEVVHVGDNERTDVGGALDAGLRAIRLDTVRPGGETRGELVATNLREVAEYLLG